MNILSDLDKQKPIAFCLVLLIMLSLIRNQPIVSYAQESEYESVAILLNNVSSAKYRFSDEEGTVGEIGFRVLGEETVSGEDTWKVEWEYAEEEGETPETMLLWISKSTGKCLQVMIDEETYTGEYAEMFGNLMLYVWVAWVGTWEEAWNFTTVYGYEELGFGRLVYLGSETKTFDSESLLIYKYRWEGYANAPEGYRAIVEWWFAPVSFGTLIVKIYWELLDHTEWARIELLSIDLVSPQPRPNIVINANLDKTQLKPNEEVTIAITASNTGNAMGTHNLTVSVGGEVKKSWLIVLNPGETKSLSHKLSFTADGSYAVRIGDQTVTITVSTTLPARFEVSGLNISPSSIKVGQSSTISITVKNTGGESGTYEVTLKVNNQVVDTETGTLSPDQSTTVSFTYTPTSEGTYNIDVNGLTGSLTVSKEEGAGAAPEIPWLVIIGAVVAVVVVVLMVLLLRRKPKGEITPPPPPPPPPSS
ncbi:MAG: CARDB domain-containing protein [Thermoproteota archaeon]